MRITFVLPPYESAPVGGYRIAYDYAAGLARRGHRVEVVHDESAALVAGHALSGMARARHRLWAGKLMATAVVRRARRMPAWGEETEGLRVRSIPLPLPALLPAADVTVATAWRTAEWLSRAGPAQGSLAYLIQHYEVWSGSQARVDATWAGPFRRVVIAKWLAELAASRGLDAVHVPNFVDTSRFVRLRLVTDRPPRVAFLTSHLAWKGTDIAIEVLQRAREQRPELQAVAFGTGPRPAALPVWIDYVRDPPHDVLVRDIYNGSVVYLCTSRTEGWHLPPAEAMACGCAVVSTDIGGVRDYAEGGVTALLAPVDDVEALAKHVVTLLSDQGVRERIAEAGWNRMQHFRLDDSLDGLELALGLREPCPS